MSQGIDRNSLSLSDYDKLSIDDRIRLAQDIWDSIAADCNPARDMPEWHQGEIDRRYEQYVKDGDKGRSWEEVRQRVLDRQCQRSG
jgi:putative addiction module component (TIGR02574 family)